MLVVIDPDSSEETVLNALRSSLQYSEQDFGDKYRSHLAAAGSVVAAAKIYILDNHNKVHDYSQLSFTCVCNLGYYRFGPKRQRKVKSKSEAVEKIMKAIDDETIQVESFTAPVYDWTDGDFSVTINGKQYLWLHPESVINIATYIERKIKEQDHGSPAA